MVFLPFQNLIMLFYVLLKTILIFKKFYQGDFPKHNLFNFYKFFHFFQNFDGNFIKILLNKGIINIPVFLIWSLIC